MERQFTLEEVIALMRKEIKTYGSQKLYAKAIGVSPAYISDVINRRREPGGAILKAIGMRRVVLYVGSGLVKRRAAH